MSMMMSWLMLGQNARFEQLLRQPLLWLLAALTCPYEKADMKLSRKICVLMIFAASLNMVMAALAVSRCHAAETLLVPQQYDSIQAAIDRARPGDAVIVSAGTYRERIRMAEGVTLRSAGQHDRGQLGLKRAEATILDGGGQIGQEPGVAMAEGSVLDGFTATNVGVYDDALWQKHHATSGNDQDHDHIGEPGVAGVAVANVNCHVMHNIVHHVGYTGIAINGNETQSANPQITDNICFRNMGGGIGFMDGAKGQAARNLCFENFFAGIGHDNASPMIVSNVCRNNIRAGIGISEGSCPIVKGNTCYENRRAGIGTRRGSTTRPLIEGNDCFENGMAGIGTEEDAVPLIRGNRCYRNKMAGIGSRLHARPLIVGNTCFENELSGIGQESDAVTTLINNHCHHNREAGLGFSACLNGRCMAVGNRVLENGKVAAGIQAGWTVTLSNNELSRTGGLPPIVMVFKGAVVTLDGNVIRGEGVAGVRVAGQVTLIGNTMEGLGVRKVGPPNFAVWALPGSEVTMANNTIANWRHGLFASGAVVSAYGNEIKNFHQTAFSIQDAVLVGAIFDNTVHSDDENAVIVSRTVKTGSVRGNRMVRGDRLLILPDDGVK